MEPVSLRAAVAPDVPDLLALWQAAAENDARPLDTAEKVATLLERDPGACVVAEIDGRIVGSLIAGWDGWRAHLYRLAVRPEVRRRGIAALLLESAEERLRALGATRIDAMVLAGNDLGHALWAASGYTVQEEWRRWVRPL